MTDNNSLRIEAGKDTYPDSFGCGIFALESTGNYPYPITPVPPQAVVFRRCRSLGSVNLG